MTRRFQWYFVFLILLVSLLGFSSCSSSDTQQDISAGIDSFDIAQEVGVEKEVVGEDVNEPQTTPLDDYVAKPDDSFFCPEEPEKQVDKGDAIVSVFKMQSLTWLDESLVDRPLWEHWLTIIAPDNAHPTRALLIIGAGDNKDDDEAPDPDDDLALIASMAGSIISVVEEVPNQRLKFADETDERYIEDGRREDEIIAYAWDKFLDTLDPVWLPRLPMTKASMRAMDVIQREHPSIEEFVVMGASKRGWTTWTVGAVDNRVIAIIPGVIDVLNLPKSLPNHFDAYGFWAPATHDYEDMGLFDRVDTPEFDALCELVDPYRYLDRYTMPKYLVNSAGDQFFTPDSWQFYYNDLPGEKHLRYMPNTDHGLNADAYFGLASFHHAILNDTPRPVYKWRMESDGTLVVECDTQPTKVLLWQATNPKARDFRLEEIGPAYTSTELHPEEDGVYRASIAAPEQGWTAFLIEMEFPNPEFGLPFFFTTGVSIVPNTLPYAQ